MKKDFLFVCNLKMNYVDVRAYKKALKGSFVDNLIICPSFCQIKEYAKLEKKIGVQVGAQNVSEHKVGAYTGDISAEMLKNAGAKFCIVGHSEQKRYHFETLSQTNAKIKELLSFGITPIVCVGEDVKRTDAQMQLAFAKKFVLAELTEVLKGINAKKVIVAYEPIWAIGTGETPSAEHIEKLLAEIKNHTHAKKVLYGGSFSAKNCKEIMNIKFVDGALIGGASLSPKTIAEMLKIDANK
jgi:triosephosphate isomerase